MKKPTKNQLENVMLLGSINSIIQRDIEFHKLVASKFSKDEIEIVRNYADSVGYTEEYAVSITDEDYAMIYASTIKQIVGIE